MKKKSLISLMLAGAMLTGVGLMAAGCGGYENVGQGVVDGDAGSRLYAKNMIVALYEKKIVLHKADIYNLYHFSVGSQSSSAYAINDKLVLRCQDEPIETKLYVNYGGSLPDEEFYDELCPECFDIEQ